MPESIRSKPFGLRALWLLPLLVPIGACALDLYGKAVHRTSAVEIPDGQGGRREIPIVQEQADGYFSHEDFRGWGLTTLRYRVTGVGEFQSEPIGEYRDTSYTRFTEANLDLDFGTPLFLEFGKKKHKIGTGYFRRPTEVFLPDPAEAMRYVGEDADRNRDGLIGTGLFYATSAGSYSAFYSPRLAWSAGGEVSHYLAAPQSLHQGFLEATRKFGNADVDVVYRLSADSAGTLGWGLGGNTAYSRGDHWEVHADAFLQDNVSRPIPTADGGIATDNQTYSFSGVAGSVYSLDAHWSFLAEYYYHDAGLWGQRYDRALAYLKERNRRGELGDAVSLRAAYGSLDLARNYFMARVAYVDQETFSAELLGLGNAQDGGGYAATRIKYGPAGWIKLLAEFGGFFGDDQSEAGTQPGTWHAESGVELFF